MVKPALDLVVGENGGARTRDLRAGPTSCSAAPALLRALRVGRDRTAGFLVEADHVS
jgi:hypothetical protein